MFRQPANQSDALSTPFLDEEHDQSENAYVSSDDFISTRERVYAVLTLAMNFVLFVAVVRGLVERSAMVRWDGAKQLYSKSMLSELLKESRPLNSSQARYKMLSLMIDKYSQD